MQEVLKLFNDGKSFREIEKLTGINRKVASRYAQEHGCSVTKRGVVGSKRKAVVDLGKFKAIDTAEKAYWLGYLFADAYIDTKTWVIEFCQKEKTTVTRFRDFMQSTASIRTKQIMLDDKRYIAYRVSICSKEICKDLIELGCTTRKSLTKQFPNLQAGLDIPFIAGYFDGNGTVSLRKNAKRLQGSVSTGSYGFAMDLSNIAGGSIFKPKSRNCYAVYIPMSFIERLAPHSHKIQSKTCPVQE